jgi:N-acetylglutamate synthase-like GNAT family acetyltransferase
MFGGDGGMKAMKSKPDKRAGERQTIAIRPAMADDVPQICAMVNALALQGTVLPRTYQSVCDSIDDWLVAGLDGEILGCISLLSYSSGLVEVRSLVVLAEYQGLGIGSRLMEQLMAEVECRKITTLFALTRKVTFFERFGFQISERDLFPEKVWNDCQQCPLLERCDETAMIFSG